MKKIIKIVIFILIFFTIFIFINTVLSGGVDSTSITYFYDEPKKSLDVVYLGASTVHFNFNTTLAYELYGYKTGLLSANSEPFAATKYLIKEAEKYQKPELYIIDIGRIIDLTEEFSDEKIRNTIDSMKYSINRIDTINGILNYKKSVKKEDYINFYFSFLMYHNSWKNNNMSKIKTALNGNKTLYKGYYFSESNIEVYPKEKIEWTNKIEKLHEEGMEILFDLIDYIDKNDLQVLFIVPVRSFETEEQMQLNYVIQFLRKENKDIINFNTVDELNIDYDKEFCSKNHLGVYGATKFTVYFGKYLKENYTLKDSKEENIDSSWKSEYNRFKEDFNNITHNDFDIILNNIQKEQS